MRRLLSLGVVIVLALTAAATRAAPPSAGPGRASVPPSVPEPLRPWIPWVMHDNEEQLCPSIGAADDDDTVCAWGGRLELSLAAAGGRFSQTWELFADGPIPLPGGASQWPLDVKVDGRPAVATTANDGEGEGTPQVRVPAGRHTVTGTFVWKRLPETLAVPPRAALLALTLAGRAVEFPSRSEAGTLFLRKDDEAQAREQREEDRLDISVHRKVTDDIPLELTTRIALNVAGKAREVVLGKSLPAGFVPQALDSALPVRIESDSRLRVQLRPGEWVITVTARNSAPTTRVSRPRPDGPWKEGEEVWVFESRPPLRVVTVEGVPGVDPQQTTLPDAWKTLPAYVMAVDATMALAERRRGDADPAADELSLQRSLWLDFDGRGLTARDEIAATFRRAWRLSMGPESRLGRAAVGGQDQFITRLERGAGAGGDGIEIRQASAVIVAESRLERAGPAIPAVGWDHDFKSVGAQLSLPPGWRLFHASGADVVSSSWLRNWTLLDLFLVLITGISIGKLFGWRAGALALVTLALAFPEGGAPKWVWLAVLVGEALVRALPAGAIRRVAGAYRLGAWVALVLIAIPFAVQHVRVGLHPGLAAEQDDDDVIFYKAAVHGFAGAPRAASGEIPEAPPPAAAPAEVGGAAADVAMGRNGKIEANPNAGRGGPRIAARDVDESLPSVDSLLEGSRTGSYGGVGRRLLPSQNLTSYDPNVLVQTGPGVPQWTGAVVHLGWNGPVEKTQRLNLWLMPPRLNTPLAFLRVALVAALIWLLLGGRSGFIDKWRLGAPGAALLPIVIGALALLAPAIARADAPAASGGYPSPELLQQLRQRVVEKAECEPNCASLGRLAVEASPDRLRLKFDVGAEAATAAPLPGHAKHWLPAQVLLDGKPAGALVRDDDGALYIRLPAGGHQIVMEGPLPARDVVQIPFPLKPHALTTAVRGWRVEGLDEDGQVSDSLQLAREEGGSKRGAGVEKDSAGGLAATSLPPFVTVVRTLELGLKWIARTTVTRQSPAGSAIVLEIPLLPGESVISEGVRVNKGKAQVNLGAEQSELAWTSTLAQVNALALEAPPAGAAAAWAETWIVNPGPLWHVTYSGIPPVQPATGDRARVPTFRPWPGEKVAIAITRPAGTGGQTLTVDAADVVLEPGIRSTAATLTVRLRSSRGGEHAFALPPGATLERLKINGAAQPLRQDGAAVTVPVAPGASTIELGWRQAGGLVFRYDAPEVDVRIASVNASVNIKLPADRWVLFVGGPRLGPAVLIWSLIIVIVVLGLALARSPWTPLRAHHWILLGLGLTQQSVQAAAVVAGLFLVFGWRRARAPFERAWRYDLSQLVLAGWTVAAVVVLATGVSQGLLGHPEMNIAGNGSSSSASGTSLVWFADRVSGPLPRPWVVSVPLLAYRLVMLAWSLWLALAVIRWVRWVWACFSERGLWRPLRAKRPTLLSAPPPPAAPPPPVPPAAP